MVKKYTPSKMIPRPWWFQYRLKLMTDNDNSYVRYTIKQELVILM